MIAENGTNEKKDIQIHVPDIFWQLLIKELSKARGLKLWPDSKIWTKVHLLCTAEEADALMRDAGPAANVLYLLQLESVAKAVAVAGVSPSQELLDMVAQVRSKLGVLAANTRM